MRTTLEPRYTVALDVDGVIRDFITGLEREYDRAFPGKWRKPVDKWGLHEFFEIGKGIYEFAWHSDYTYDIFAFSPIYPEAKIFCDYIHDNHTLVIATNQPSYMSTDATVDWLNGNEIRYHDLFMGEHKFLIDFDFLIDDKLSTIIDYRKAGIGRPIIYDQPWNKVDDDSDFDRAYSYNNIIRLLQGDENWSKKNEIRSI